MELWTKMINETALGVELKKRGITIRFVVDDPEVLMHVDGNGVLFGDEAKDKVPEITMRMSGNMVHKYWLKQVDIPNALALQLIKARGPVGKLLQVLHLLKAGEALYKDYCLKYSLPIE